MRRTVTGSTAQNTPGAATLDEASARRLCLLQACEDGPTDAALWSPEDAAWASRLADETAGAEATDARWLAERARHAEQRLLPRRPTLARAFAGGYPAARAAAWAALAGLVFGVAADLVGHAQLIDLLAAPVWAVVAWNLVVYVWVVVGALRRGGTAAREGPLRRAMRRWLAGRAARRGVQAAAPEQRFAARWAAVAAPLAAERAAAALHVAAAALAVGLMAGLYARALVLDYHVGWQSTLLDPAQVHALLSVLLAPASALTGIAVPDVQAVAALRTAGPAVAGAAAGAGAGAANAFGAAAGWLHLLAATVGWAVLVPRLVLALRAALAAAWRARRLPVAIDDAATLKALHARRRHAGAAARGGVRVWPHGFTPAPAATLGLQRLIAATLGDGVALHVAAPTAYGDEDRPAAPPPGPPAAWRIAWFELAATPEDQVQGRFIAQLGGGNAGNGGGGRAVAPATGAAAPAACCLVLVDESSYRQRLGAASPRLAERRQAWQALADAAGVGLASVDLEALAAGGEVPADVPTEARQALETALAGARAREGAA